MGDVLADAAACGGVAEDGVGDAPAVGVVGDADGDVLSVIPWVLPPLVMLSLMARVLCCRMVLCRPVPLPCFVCCPCLSGFSHLKNRCEIC